MPNGYAYPTSKVKLGFVREIPTPDQLPTNRQGVRHQPVDEGVSPGLSKHDACCGTGIGCAQQSLRAAVAQSAPRHRAEPTDVGQSHSAMGTMGPELPRAGQNVGLH
jgi:hypothetical protein